MSSQIRHMSDGNAVHCCLLGTEVTHKLEESSWMCTFPQCKSEAAVCSQGLGRKVGNAHPGSIEGEVMRGCQADKRLA